jgi:dCMP deaminase
MNCSRPEWDVYFMMIASVAATRSTCLRRKVGAVIVRERQIVSTGYNGAPKGLPHCADVGCLRSILSIPSGERHEMCRGSHAEMNAIAQAAAAGISTVRSHIYCTHEPCSFCTKAIINAGIEKVIFLNPYPDDLAREMRTQASIEVVCLSPVFFASAWDLLEDVFGPAELARRNKTE